MFQRISYGIFSRSGSSSEPSGASASIYISSETKHASNQTRVLTSSDTEKRLNNFLSKSSLFARHFRGLRIAGARFDRGGSPTPAGNPAHRAMVVVDGTFLVKAKRRHSGPVDRDARDGIYTKRFVACPERSLLSEPPSRRSTHCIKL